MNQCSTNILFCSFFQGQTLRANRVGYPQGQNWWAKQWIQYCDAWCKSSHTEQCLKDTVGVSALTVCY